MVVDLDLRNTLCLACSSSIRSKNQALHITRCCNQVICDSCVQSNPRLATYDPCLLCLGGIGASRGKTQLQTLPKTIKDPNSDPHSSLISDDETMFVLGYDSDEDAEEQEFLVKEDAREFSQSLPPKPPTYQAAMNPCIKESPQPSTQLLDATPPTPTSTTSAHRKYYINPRDTVHGIALRFGVDARELCRHNNLPSSTLNTTPHLLHTRVFLELPPSSKPVPLQYVLSEEDRAKREAQRERERAEKRLQMVTKEVDWHVAKTYIALADGCDIDDESVDKQKEMSMPPARPAAGPSNSDLALRAVDMYLDDEEWEQREINAGRSPTLPRFPLSPQCTESSTDAQTKWWSWKS